jgi:hypothetical protein
MIRNVQPLSEEVKTTRVQDAGAGFTKGNIVDDAWKMRCEN